MGITNVGTNYIYIVGGYDGHKQSNECERYDPIKNEWIKVNLIFIVIFLLSFKDFNKNLFIFLKLIIKKFFNFIDSINDIHKSWRFSSSYSTVVE